MTIVPLSAIPPEDVEALLDRAFGTDRRGRTAYRIREGIEAIAELSFAAVDADGALLGSIQCWPVELVGDDGVCTPMVMVGPVAVEPAIQRAGIGKDLMRHMLDAADASHAPGHDALMLVGDPEYYSRFFGFDAANTCGWRLPGPFEPRRLLARGSAPCRPGVVGPRVYASSAPA